MAKVLIQANNLDRVIDVFMYIYLHTGCTQQDVADYTGITFRQAQYYVSACRYLGLIDKGLAPTPLADDIFANNKAEITERVYECVINDEVMGRVFSRMYLLPNENINQFALELVKEYFPGYSSTVYNRRADNIVKWCNRIIQYVNNKI